jgi:acetylglutamate kinase
LLLLLTDVAGVKDANGSPDPTQPRPDPRHDHDGTIFLLLIPKVETALKAIEDGVRAVVILDGRLPNAHPCLNSLHRTWLGFIIRYRSHVKSRQD